MAEGWPSKRKYITLNAAFFIAIGVFLATFAVTLLYKPGRSTVRDLSRLETGMTPLQVTGILGEPNISLQTHVTSDNTEETWTYYLPKSRWSAITQTWQLKFYNGRLDSWWLQQ